MRERLLNCSLIVIAGLLTYLCATLAGLLSVDDVGMINSVARDDFTVKSLFLSGASEYYRPLAVVAYRMNAFLFGLEPFSFHAFSVVVHVANSLLLYWLALVLLEEREDREWPALSASLFFLLSPLNSEAVTWVSARPDLMSAFFFLLAVTLLVKLRRSPSAAAVVAFSLAYLASLCSKESAVALCAIAPAYLLWQARRDRVSQAAALTWSAAVVACSGVYAWLRIGNRLQVDPGVKSVVSGVVSNVTGERNHFPPLLDGLGAFGFYLKKLLLPYPLSFTILRYDRFWGFVSLAVGTAVAIWLFKRYRFALLPLLVVFLGIVPPVLAYVGRIPWTPFGERYLYLPMIGFSILAALLLSDLRKLPRIVPVACLLLLSFPTMARVAVWCDGRAFWNDALAQEPSFAKSHSALGAIELQEHNYREAERHFDKAISLGFDTQLAWENLARVHAATGDYSAYEGAMVKAASRAARPRGVYEELVKTLLNAKTGRRPEFNAKAIRYYLLAVEKDPSYLEAYYNVGKLYLADGDTVNARRYLRLYADRAADGYFRPFALKLLRNLEGKGEGRGVSPQGRGA